MVRYCIASATYWGLISSSPAKSAIVRATLRIRSLALADKPNFLIAASSKLYRFRLYRNDIDFLFLFFHLHSLRSLRLFYHSGATGIYIKYVNVLAKRSLWVALGLHLVSAIGLYK